MTMTYPNPNVSKAWQQVYNQTIQYLLFQCPKVEPYHKMILWKLHTTFSSEKEMRSLYSSLIDTIGYLIDSGALPDEYEIVIDNIDKLQRMGLPRICRTYGTCR